MLAPFAFEGEHDLSHRGDSAYPGVQPAADRVRALPTGIRGVHPVCSTSTILTAARESRSS